MILGIIVHLGFILIDTVFIEGTMSPTGPKTELVATMRDMDTEVSILGLMSAGLTEDMEVDILMMLWEEMIHFPVGDSITVMVTSVMITPVTMAMVITVMVITVTVMATTTIGTTNCRSSLN